MLAALPPFVADHLQWFVCGAIVVLGLVVYGFFDLMRLSFTRIWAISSVCFTESYRKRILLITPLAIVGVLAVAQLQQPIDEQDAIHQTVKFCLFATGLLLAVTAIILACTNLPREIESRVIYTVVTKPPTRMEIVCGKVLGFAKVSALILLVMGLFTFGYMHSRAWLLGRGIDDRLKAGEVDASSVGSLEHYRKLGLLTAKSLRTTDDMQVYAKLDAGGKSDTRYMIGESEGMIVVPFSISREDLIPPGDPTQTPGAAGLVVKLNIGYERDPSVPLPNTQQSQSYLPVTVAAPTTAPASQPAGTLPPAQVAVQILDANQNTLIAPRSINDGKNITLADPQGKEPVTVTIQADALGDLRVKEKTPLFYVQVTGVTQGLMYVVGPRPVELLVPAAPGYSQNVILPATDQTTGVTALPILQGRQGTSGQQIRGAPQAAPVAVFKFNHIDVQPSEQGSIAFEIKSGVERTSENETANDDLTRVQAVVVNRSTGQASEPVEFSMESNRLAYFTAPASSTAGGNFDVQIRCLTPGHLMGLFPTSLSVIATTQSFDLNLLKSLFIMWLMAILVITVSIFASTFLSWPIAIVLTVLILLGRWGVEQLGDATQPGIGNLVATDMGFTDPNKAKVVSSSVEALSRGLNMLASVLPDISKFASTEDIERGLVIPPERLRDSLAVLGTYGLATLTLAYVFLRQKEVAP